MLFTRRQPAWQKRFARGGRMTACGGAGGKLGRVVKNPPPAQLLRSPSLFVAFVARAKTHWKPHRHDAGGPAGEIVKRLR